MCKQIAGPGIYIYNFIMNDPVAGFHPLYSSGIYFSKMTLAIQMHGFATKNIRQCCNAPVRMCSLTVRLFKWFITRMFNRDRMIEKYKWAYCINIPVAQYAIDNIGTHVGSLPLRRETYFLLHLLLFFNCL